MNILVEIGIAIGIERAGIALMIDTDTEKNISGAIMVKVNGIGL
jgi:hypothetical protein